MNRLSIAIPCNKQKPHFNSNEVGLSTPLTCEESTCKGSSTSEGNNEGATHHASATAIHRVTAHTLRLFLFAAVALTSIGTASAVHYRKQAGGRDYNVQFADNPHHFGDTAPYTAPLEFRAQDLHACSANFRDCPEHTRPIVGADYGIDLGDTRQRLVLSLPGIWDADTNLSEAFFEYQKQIGAFNNEGWQRAYPRNEPDWTHSFWHDHSNLGRVTMDELGGAWIHFHPRDLSGAGTYKFRGYVKDTVGNHSTPSESQFIQVWGPPEPRSLHVSKEAFYEGQTYTLYADAFHPNGIETRANIYLEGEGIDGRKQLNGEDLKAHGYEVTFSHFLSFENPGNYRIIVELTDEHRRKANEDLVLDITCHPKVVIRGLLKDRLTLETGYDFQDRPSDAERADLESKLDEDIHHYEHLVHHCDVEDHVTLIDMLLDRVETSWRTLQALKKLGRGGEEFQNREREHYYSLATYYYHLALREKEAYYATSDYEYEKQGAQLGHWEAYSVLSLEAQAKVPEDVGIAYPDATELRDLPMEF